MSGDAPPNDDAIAPCRSHVVEQWRRGLGGRPSGDVEEITAFVRRLLAEIGFADMRAMALSRAELDTSA